MKRIWLWLLLALFAGCFVDRLVSQSSLTMSTGSTLASCPTPVSSSKALIFCNVAGDASNPDGAYVSANGGAYSRVSSGGAGGVGSFNGRTGNVLPASGDYTHAQISGQITAAAMPTTQTCTLTAVIGSANTVTLSGCH